MVSTTRVAMAILLLLASSSSALAARSVAYRVRARTVTWIPIRLPDIEHAISAKAAAELAQGGLMRLTRIRGRRGPGKAELLLEMTGEVVEDAGNFTVTLALRPVRDAGLPSFVTSATVSISGKPKRVMYTLIEQAASRAAGRMRAALRSMPGFGGRRGGRQYSAAELFDWGRVTPPAVRVRSADLRLVLNGRLSWHKRKEAFFRVAGLAYDSADVRHVLERVALTDPDKFARLYAVRMLEPSTRRHRFTQQVVLAVLREDADPKVRGSAFDLSEHFFGLTPQQTAQTWVQLLAAKVNEFGTRSHGRLVKLMQFRMETANLDLALIQCLKQQEVLREGRDRKKRCLELVEQVPPRRRSAILMAYLNRPLSALGNDLPDRWKRGPFGEAARLLLEDRCQMTAARKLLWRLLEETNDPRTSAVVLTALAENQITGRVLRVAGKLYGQATDRHVRDKLYKLLMSMDRRHYAPWGVLARPAVAQVVRDALEQGNLDRHHRRRLERLLKGLSSRRKMPHRAGLAQHLRADAPPAPAAIDYFARCVMEHKGRAAKDCAGGLHWLAATYPQLRRQAVAAALGLARQTRQELARRARYPLQSVTRNLRSKLRKLPEDQPQWGQCPLR